MTDELFVQTFIDKGLWERAGWIGVFWLWAPEGGRPPGMGLLFKNIEAGRSIFEEWRDQLGYIDEYEQLRISIVEGSIPGEKPGYSVRVGTHYKHVRDRTNAESEGKIKRMMLSTSRVHRMTSLPESPNLTKFKEGFQHHQRYFLLPAGKDSQSPLGATPHWELSLEKSEIYFRHVDELSEGDWDYDVLAHHKG